MKPTDIAHEQYYSSTIIIVWSLTVLAGPYMGEIEVIAESKSIEQTYNKQW